MYLAICALGTSAPARNLCPPMVLDFSIASFFYRAPPPPPWGGGETEQH